MNTTKQILIVAMLLGAAALAPGAHAALVAYWPFDETNGTVAAELVSGKNGSLVNFPADNSQWQPGMIGNALSFDGINDHVIHSFNLPRKQGTIMHWLKPAVVGENMVTVYESDSPGTAGVALYDGFGDPAKMLEIHSGVTEQWQARYQDGSGEDGNNAAGFGRFKATGASAAAGVWTHVAMTWNTSGDLVLYVNCQEVERTSMAAGKFANLGTTQRFIGRPSANTRFWNGLIDEVRIYNTALSPEEIRAVACQTVDVVALEVVQAIQNWNNTVPLVSNKITYVRAHFEVPGPSLEAVTGKLRGFRDGMELPGSPLSPVNSAGLVVTTTNAAAARSDLSKALNFLLPANWRSGTVTLQLVPKNVVPPALNFACKDPAEPGGAPNDCTVTVTFAKTEPLLLKLFKLRAPGQPVTSQHILETVQRIKAIFPIDTPQYQISSLNLTTEQATNLITVLDLLEVERVSDKCATNPACKRLYVGVLRGQDQGGLADPRNGVACGTLVDGFLFNRNALPHEAGHLLGREHTVNRGLFGTTNACPFAPGFGGVLGSCDECLFFGDDESQTNFPYATINGVLRPALGPMDMGEAAKIFGLDTHSMRVADPTQKYDMMSYCIIDEFPQTDRRWISHLNYEAIRATINSTFASAVGVQPFGLPPEPQDFLLVRGEIDLADDSTRFHRLLLLPNSSAPPNPPAGDYVLQLLNATGDVLDQIAFEPSLSKPTFPALGSTVATFLIPVPANPAIQHIVVQRGDAVLATHSASANAPTVQVVFPNGGETITEDPVVLQWNSADADGDALTHVVQYSADGGATWTTLAIDWPEQMLTVERAALAASNNARLRVIVTDGFNTAVDESDAPFTVLNNAPEVFILTPTAGQRFFGEQPILLEAAALDPEDGQLAGASLQWSSSLDGALGSGEEVYLAAEQISVGTHVITLTATDSHSASSSTNVTIIVSDEPPPPPAAHDLAVISMKAPKKVTLKEGALPKPSRVQVTIQNLSPHAEMIGDLATLENLVTLDIESLGDCDVPVANLMPPKKGFPVILAPKKKLKLVYTVTIDCANDASAGTPDYRYTAQVNHSALGTDDTSSGNDVCPRPPNLATGDKGCGNKDKATKQLGADVLTDVVVKN